MAPSALLCVRSMLPDELKVVLEVTRCRSGTVSQSASLRSDMTGRNQERRPSTSAGILEVQVPTSRENSLGQKDTFLQRWRFRPGRPVAPWFPHRVQCWLSASTSLKLATRHSGIRGTFRSLQLDRSGEGVHVSQEGAFGFFIGTAFGPVFHHLRVGDSG